MTELLPWHIPAFKKWHSLPKHAHAYLLVAPEQTGGEDLLHQLASSVLCETPSENQQACATCASCQLIAAFSHPDFRVIRPSIWDVHHPIEELRPEKPSKEIGIAQIRDLANMVNQTSHRGGMRVVLIYPADKLNLNAANALLKTLEEPPEHTLFLLLTHDVQRLLPTIISRCQRINLAAPNLAQAVEYLNQTIEPNSDWADYLTTENGAVMRVAKLYGSPYFKIQNQLTSELAHGAQMDFLRLAEQFDKHLKDADKARLAGEAHTLDMSILIDWLQRWLTDLTTIAQQAGSARYYPKQRAALEKIAAHVSPAKLHEWQQQLLNEQRFADHPLNSKVWLEKLFLQYTQLV